MAFPPDFMERVKSRFLLSEVIGRRVALKRQGREFSALCPFHREKSPSFTVNDDKGFYHCFGCGAHGDAIEFVKQHGRLSYREAVEQLARDGGIPIPAPSPEAKRQAEAHATHRSVLEEACRWFEQQLEESGGAQARDYLTQRGLLPETIRAFHLGVVPPARDALKRHLLKQGFALPQLLEAGLVIQPDEGNAYDRFRARVMFPIRDASGRIIAFGGRTYLPALPGDAQAPKYLNSPETPLFKKGEILFNYDQARRAAREPGGVLAVEGYLDVIALHQAGLKHAVAPLGTAMTPMHLERMWQAGPEPAICLDGDAAGSRAMLRAAEIALPLLKPGYGLRFAALPPGEDPDSLVRRQGAAAMRSCLASSRALSEMLWETLSAAHPQKTPEARAGLERELMALAQRIDDTAMRSHYRHYFQQMLRAQPPPRRQTRNASDTSLRQPRSATVAAMAGSEEHAILHSLARRILQLLLSAPHLLEKGEIEEWLAHPQGLDPSLERLAQCLHDLSAEGDIPSAAALQARLMEEGLEEALQGLARNGVTLEHPEQAVEALAELRAAYSQALLTGEYRSLEREIAQRPTEETMGRFIEVQQQLREAKQRRYVHIAPADQ